MFSFTRLQEVRDSRPILAGQHAHPIISFSYLQIVRDPIRYLQNSVLTSCSPLPAAYREYVFSSDTCRTIYSCRLLCLGSTWSHLILAEQHANTVSFARLQRVCDFVRHLQNSMLTPSSPSPTYSLYVISPDTCRTVCSRRHRLLHTGSTFSRPIHAEQYTHVVFSFA